jgi:hypothetical protein
MTSLPGPVAWGASWAMGIPFLQRTPATLSPACRRDQAGFVVCIRMIAQGRPVVEMAFAERR